MLVQDVMTEQVFTLQPDRKLLIAEDLMEWAEVRHIPVVDDDQRVVGIVTLSDMLRASTPRLGNPAEVFDAKQQLAKLQVQDIMSEPVCIDAKATVQAAARMMRAGKRSCLPVVDNHDKLLGIVTVHDMLAIVEELDPAALAAGPGPAVG
ncbi:MAG: CBS domain-containing protein [Planctomycetes bacterium]|nr:CBS domain-containing protein [Planctomycetota bacterium]